VGLGPSTNCSWWCGIEANAAGASDRKQIGSAVCLGGAHLGPTSSWGGVGLLGWEGGVAQSYATARPVHGPFYLGRDEDENPKKMLWSW